MKNLFVLLILSILLTACATQPPAKPWTSGEKNACVPEAIVMDQGLEKAGISAKVLLITTPSWKHAVTIYLWRPGQNQLWVWDASWGSVRVRAFFDDAFGVAKEWVKLTNKSTVVTAAEFL